MPRPRRRRTRPLSPVLLLADPRRLRPGRERGRGHLLRLGHHRRPPGLPPGKRGVSVRLSPGALTVASPDPAFLVPDAGGPRTAGGGTRVSWRLAAHAAAGTARPWCRACGCGRGTRHRSARVSCLDQVDWENVPVGGARVLTELRAGRQPPGEPGATGEARPSGEGRQVCSCRGSLVSAASTSPCRGRHWPRTALRVRVGCRGVGDPSRQFPSRPCSRRLRPHLV